MPSKAADVTPIKRGRTTTTKTRENIAERAAQLARPDRRDAAGENKDNAGQRGSKNESDYHPAANETDTRNHAKHRRTRGTKAGPTHWRGTMARNKIEEQRRTRQSCTSEHCNSREITVGCKMLNSGRVATGQGQINRHH